MASIVIVGASGTIGRAFVKLYQQMMPEITCFALSRQIQKSIQSEIELCCDLKDEQSIVDAAKVIQAAGPVKQVIVATGVLHDAYCQPEKSWSHLSMEALSHVFAINTFGPALLAKHFLPLLDQQQPSLMALLSARVGSIGDNRLGGWYAYRASKAALNMLIKTFSIELARTNKQAAVIGLHPGTVDSGLSQPFQRNVPQGKLFSPEFAVEKMQQVLAQVRVGDSGKILAWDGQVIEY